MVIVKRRLRIAVEKRVARKGARKAASYLLQDLEEWDQCPIPGREGSTRKLGVIPRRRYKNAKR